MQDKVSILYSLRGATRSGKSKLSFDKLGLLPFIKSKLSHCKLLFINLICASFIWHLHYLYLYITDIIWATHKGASGTVIEEAVGEHLRFACVRERRKAKRSADSISNNAVQDHEHHNQHTSNLGTSAEYSVDEEDDF